MALSISQFVFVAFLSFAGLCTFANHQSPDQSSINPLRNDEPVILQAKRKLSSTGSSNAKNGVSLPLYSRPLSASSPPLLKSLNAFRKRSPNATRLSSTKAATKVMLEYNINLMVEVQMGTPLQKQLMVVDTGSELSWVQCVSGGFPNCFNPTLSSSYSALPCNSSVCTTPTSDFEIFTSCDDSNHCRYACSYADGYASEGNIGQERITITPTEGNPLKIPGFVFGCVSSALPGTPGLMGLNRGALSFISQMKGRLANKFSYCIADRVLHPNSPGVLYFGDSPFAGDLKYTRLITLPVPLPYFNKVAYSVRLQGIKVGEKLLPIPKSAFEPDHTGAGQTMIDSGTQFTFLLEEAYTPLRQAFLQQNAGRRLNPIDGNSVFEALDLCYDQPADEPFPQVSPVTLLFESAHLTLESHQLLYPIPGRSRTIYCFTFGNSDLVPVEANIIGNHHQQNVWIEYDLQNSRVGFAPAKCSTS